jgi:hypothetical protein
MKSERIDTIWQGIIAGLIGYASVALLVGVMDVFQGRSFFFTAALLGEAVFHGLRDPAQLVVWPGPVFAYNGLHLVTFLAFGMIAAWLAYLSERGSQYWYLAVVLYLLVLAHLFAAVMLLTEELRGVIPEYEIWIPSIVAGTAIAVYLLRVHPALRGAMREWRETTD